MVTQEFNFNLTSIYTKWVNNKKDLSTHFHYKLGKIPSCITKTQSLSQDLMKLSKKLKIDR